jgi:hypothetical protein
MKFSHERDVSIRVNGLAMPTEPPAVEHQRADNQIILTIIAQPVGKRYRSQELRFACDLATTNAGYILCQT